MRRVRACIPELDDLFGRVGKDRLAEILSGDDTVEPTAAELEALKDFVDRQHEYVPPSPGEFFTDATLKRMLRAECPADWSDEACRNWLDERLLESALEEVAECGGDVRCYAEPTKFNVFRVLQNVRRKRLESLAPEERERRLILALPGRIVARHAANRSLPEARRWMDVRTLACRHLAPVVLERLPLRAAEAGKCDAP